MTMCGRYRIDDGRNSIELHDIIEEVNRRVVVEPVKTSGEILPTDIVPVMANSKKHDACCLRHAVGIFAAGRQADYQRA